MLTCSSAAAGARSRTSSGSTWRTGCLAVARRTPRRRRGRSARRRAAPRRRPSGTPRGSGRRTTRSRSSASRHISSPSSRKSATRPAFSSDWLSSSPPPGTLHVLPELLAQRGDLLERRLRGPASLRAMPQSSHMILPSSRWNDVDRALALDRRAAAACAPSTVGLGAALTSAWSASTFSSLCVGQVVADRCRAGRSSRRPGPASARWRRGGWRRGRRSSPRRATNRPGIVLIRL